MSLVKKIDFRKLGDDRGGLVAIEGNINIPFPVKRVYYIYGTRSGIARGFHAHRTLQQIAICVAGSCRMLLDDGCTKEEVLMDSETKGVIINPMMWHEMYGFSDGCVLLVLASDRYDEQDYIRDYKQFLKESEL